jgi:hypothetical protein
MESNNSNSNNNDKCYTTSSLRLSELETYNSLIPKTHESCPNSPLATFQKSSDELLNISYKTKSGFERFTFFLDFFIVCLYAL